MQRSESLTAISKSQASFCSENLMGAASPQANNALPNNFLMAVFAAEGLSKRVMNVLEIVNVALCPWPTAE